MSNLNTSVQSTLPQQGAMDTSTEQPKPVLWCEEQSLDENNIVICLAHMAEDRVLDCPYASLEKRLAAKYPCSDYRALTTR